MEKKAAPFITIQVDPSLSQGALPSAESSVEKFLTGKVRTVEFQSFAANANEKICPTYDHPVVAAARMAFSDHLPLALSPQMFWLMSLQGFSRHVEHDPEVLRAKFVNFQGKKTLEVIRNDFVMGKKTNDWPSVFESFVDKIKENIGEVNYSNLSTDFSQTNPIEEAVFNLTVMDSMKSYFQYLVRTLCGIPRVRLYGTKEDWQLLKEKIKGLGQYNFEWWTDKVLPIIDKMIACFDGEKDVEFWKCIYKSYSRGGSGAITRVNGWITSFFPYVSAEKKGEFKVNSQIKTLEQIIEDAESKEEQGLDRSLIPDGFAKTDFKWIYYGTPYDMQFVGGFGGIAVNDGFLKPTITWGVGQVKEK